MPSVTRRRTLSAAPEDVWRVVSDPERLAEWWPGVTRVEEVSPGAWTKVLSSPRGRAVRADYTLVESEAPRRLAWRQEVEESPFERILAEATTTLELEPEPSGGTRASVTVRQRPRGLARLGFMQMRRATARQAAGAVDGLATLLGAPD